MSETMSPPESIPPTQSLSTRHELPTWAHFVWLIYLGFLFSPLLYPEHGWTWLWPTLVSLPVFVTLYVIVVLKFRRSDPPGAEALPEILTMAVMGLMLAPFNESANTYVIYSISMASSCAVCGRGAGGVCRGVVLAEVRSPAVWNYGAGVHGIRRRQLHDVTKPAP
jgi:hypothetical protein